MRYAKDWIEYQCSNWDENSRSFGPMVFGFMKQNVANYLEVTESLAPSNFGHGVSSDLPCRAAQFWMLDTYGKLDNDVLQDFFNRYDDFFDRHKIDDAEKFKAAKNFVNNSGLNPQLTDGIDINFSNHFIKELDDSLKVQEAYEKSVGTYQTMNIKKFDEASHSWQDIEISGR